MLPTRDAACVTQCILRWLYIENFWETRQKKEKEKVRKSLNAATEQLELKVGFCKLKCTQSPEKLHRILKIKDGI